MEFVLLLNTKVLNIIKHKSIIQLVYKLAHNI